MRADWVGAISLLLGLFAPPTSANGSDCQRGLDMLGAVLELCGQDSAYCGDVPEYRNDAEMDCGGSPQVDGYVLAMGYGGLLDPPPADRKYPPLRRTPDPNVPRSCAFFTRPAAEEGRLNYYAAGAAVCYSDRFFRCEVHSNGSREWVDRGPCNDRAREAADLEGTSSAPDN